MIEIIRHIEINKGPVVCSFAIKLPKMKGFCIYNLTLFEKDSQRWITFPSIKFEKEGKTKYLPHCGFENHEFNDQFKKEIIIALDAYLALKNPSLQIQTSDDECPF